MNFQQRLIKARKNIHFTGKNVADKAGIKYQTYMNYENKGSLPSAENLIKLSSVLGVSIDYLLKGYESITDPPINDTQREKEIQELEKDIDNLQEEAISFGDQPYRLELENTIKNKVKRLKELKDGSDIEPLLNRVERLIQSDKNVSFQKKKLTNIQKRTIHSFISLLDSYLLFDNSNKPQVVFYSSVDDFLKNRYQSDDGQ